jgi:hypothetical protein
VPKARPALETDCSQADAYELVGITPAFWFGYGDDTPGSYDGAEDGVPLPAAESGNCGPTQPVARAHPPAPDQLATVMTAAGAAPDRCGTLPSLFFKTYGHRDWGSGWGSALATRGAPYLPGGDSGSSYEGIALWAKSDRRYDKAVMFIIDTAQTAKPSDGTPAYRADPEDSRQCPQMWLDEHGDPVLLVKDDDDGMLTRDDALTDEEGHALRDDPRDCKAPEQEDGAVIYRMDASGHIIIGSETPKPGDCGNSFQYLLETTTEWRLYLIPFDSFWQSALPNRDPNGLDADHIYQFTFRAAKEKHIELWVDGLSFYRRVGSASGAVQ